MRIPPTRNINNASFVWYSTSTTTRATLGQPATTPIVPASLLCPHPRSPWRTSRTRLPSIRTSRLPHPHLHQHPHPHPQQHQHQHQHQPPQKKQSLGRPGPMSTAPRCPQTQWSPCHCQKPEPLQTTTITTTTTAN